MSLHLRDKKSAVPKNKILLCGELLQIHFDGIKAGQGYDYVVLEGRPGLSSLTSNCLNLQKKGIVPTVMADNMAGYLFQQKLLKEVWLGYNICDERGFLCPVGGLIVAVLGYRHGIPVYLKQALVTNKQMGQAKDLQKFNGKALFKTRINAYVPLTEWVPEKYLTLLEKSVI